MMLWTSPRPFFAAFSSMATIPPPAFMSPHALRRRTLSTPVHSLITTLSSSSSASFSSSASSFQPAPPPPFHGTPIFKGIPLHSPTTEAIKRNKDPNAVFVVTGASRGIGFQYVQSLFHRSQGHIVAACRSPRASNNQLRSFLEKNAEVKKRVTMVKLDLQNQDSIDALGQEVSDRFGRVDGLFNVAGLLGDGTSTPGPERSLRNMDRAWVEQTMAVNVVGPVMVCQALAPLMKSKGRRNKEGEGERAKSVIVNMSARVGSISDNQLGGWYSYRFSKAALNQATKTMALELKRQGTWVLSLHPGTTDTDLSKPFQKNVRKDKLFPVEFTVERLLDLVDGMEEEHSGGFYDWAGKALPF